VAKNQALQIAREATDKATQLGDRFGLNPSARGQMHLRGAEESERSEAARRLLS